MTAFRWIVPIAAVALLVAFSSPASGDFGTAADCHDASAQCDPSGQITITLTNDNPGACSFSATISWGDGTSTPAPNYSNGQAFSHSYSAPGIYTISATGSGHALQPNTTCTFHPGSERVEVPAPAAPVPPAVVPQPPVPVPQPCDKVAAAKAFADWQTALSRGMALRSVSTDLNESAQSQFANFYPGLLEDMGSDLKEFASQLFENSDYVDALNQIKEMATHPLAPAAAGSSLSSLLVQWFYNPPVINGQIQTQLSKNAVRRLTGAYSEIVTKWGARVQQKAITSGEKLTTSRAIATGAGVYVVTRAYIRLVPAVADAALSLWNQHLADEADQQADVLLARYKTLSQPCSKSSAVGPVAASAARVAGAAPAARAARSIPASVYRRVPKLPKVHAVPLHAGVGLTSKLLRAPERLLTAEESATARTIAITAATSRALAAASHGDSAALKRQWKFVHQQAAALVRLYRRLPALRAAAASALKRAGIAPAQVTILQPVNALDILHTLGLPVAVRRLVHDLQLPSASLKQFAAPPFAAGTIPVDPVIQVASPELAAADATLSAQFTALSRQAQPPLTRKKKHKR